MSEPEMEIHTFEMLDTGIGREAGYRDDKEFIAAMKAKREALKELLKPEVWERFEALEREEERKFLFGDLSE